MLHEAGLRGAVQDGLHGVLRVLEPGQPTEEGGGEAKTAEAAHDVLAQAHGSDAGIDAVAEEEKIFET